MKGISPLTLGLILLALPVLGWLWWTSGELEAPLTAVRSGDGAAVAVAESEDSVLRPRKVPPIEDFTAVVDRPLFAATRHAPGTAEEPDPVQMSEPDLPAAPEDNIADRYRLIGTVEEEGRIFALLAGNDGSFVRLRRGDRLESWTVNAINRQRVLMVSGERATELTLLPEGLR